VSESGGRLPGRGRRVPVGRCPGPPEIGPLRTIGAASYTPRHPETPLKAAAVATAAVLLLAPTLLRADEVLLKGGAKFSGRIESQTDTMITINIGDGVVGVP